MLACAGIAIVALGLIGMFQNATPVAAGSWRNLVYVANREDTASSGSISVVDPASSSVVATIALPNGVHPRELAITPDGSTVYATTANALVIPIDTASQTAGAAITSGSLLSTWGIAVSPDGKTVYVADSKSSTLTPIDTALHAAGASISITGTTADMSCSYSGLASGVAITPDGTAAYVAMPSWDIVARVDLSTGTVTDRIPVHCPMGIAVTRDGSFVYAGSPDDNFVTAIYAGPSPQKLGTTGVTYPYGMAASWQTTAVASFTGNYVRWIGIPNALGPLTSVGAGPRGVAMSPDGATLYITSDGSGLLQSMGVAGGTCCSATVGVGATPHGIAITPEPLSGSTATGSAVEGQSFSGTVATFSDPNAARPLGDFRAQIDWGDGSPASAGTVSGGAGSFSVSGTHTYAEEGSFPIKVYLGFLQSVATTLGGTMTVADAPLTATAASGTTAPPSSFSGPVATFTDPDPAGVTTDYTATIFWGDGSSGSGTVAAASGGFSVSGNHSYSTPPSRPISAHICDAAACADAGLTVDHIAVSPNPATTAAGVYPLFTATAYDASNAAIGDVSSQASFSISPDGSCTSMGYTGMACGSTVAGPHTVSATYASKTGIATLQVSAGALDHMTLSETGATCTRQQGQIQQVCSMAAGTQVTYHAEGFDRWGNDGGDVTAATTFTMTPDGTCTGAVCAATVAGAHTVTGTDGTVSANDHLTVTAGPLDHLGLSPASTAITAGASQSYAATGYDKYGNSVGDVTSATTFSIALASNGSADGSCTNATCTATTAAPHTVTGTDGSAGGVAQLAVNPAAGDHLVLAPPAASIPAGSSQLYTATLADHYGNTIADVTSSASFSYTDASFGLPLVQPCSGSTCAPTNAGTYPINASYTIPSNTGPVTVQGSATLTVTSGALDHIVLSPASSTIVAGGSQIFTATGYDRFGNSTGDVTSSTTFSITRSSDGAADGSCTGAGCTATSAVPHTVTGNDGGIVATATLAVTPAPLDHLGLTPASSTITDGGSQTYSATGYDQYGNSRGDLTPWTTFSIGPDGTCTGATCTPAHAGAHTVTGKAGGAAGAATLSVVPAQLTITASSATMTYADPVPPIKASYAGWVNGNGPGSLTTAPTCTTAATSTSPAGAYQSSCSGAADPDYTITYVPGTVTVVHRAATLAYTGPLMVSTGAASATSVNVTLQALVTQQNDGSLGDITRSAPVFLLYRSSNVAMSQADVSCTATTVTSVGVATCTVSGLGVDNWTVVIQEPGSNGYYTATNSQPVVLTVYAPTSGSSTSGGGWIVDPGTGSTPVAVSSANPHGNFGFSVHYKSGSTAPQGQSVYVFRGADGNDYIVKSTSWQSGGFAVTSNHGSFSGKCTVIVVASATGQVVPGLGGGNFSYRVDVTDNSAQRTTDSYAITVYDASGAVYHQAGTASSPLPLGGGHVRVV